MVNSHESLEKDASSNSGLQIIRHPGYQPCGKLLLPWFDIRVFYVRISNFAVDGYMPEHLTLRHVPLSPDTVLEVNGARCNIDSEGSSCRLRRNRVDKKFEEVTFVSTDSIRLTGSVKFEVFDGEDPVLCGVLEMAHCIGLVGESKNSVRRWNMNCESMLCPGTGFLKGKQIGGSDSLAPTIEVYVAGSFSATPIILTKTLQINFRKKQNRKGALDSIPECETTEYQKDMPSGLDLQVAEAEYRNYKNEPEEEYGKMYWRHTEYMEGEGEDGELSWFNAGVRVGVGIGLGICLGVGIGVGLLVRTYHSTSRNFRRHLP